MVVSEVFFGVVVAGLVSQSIKVLLHSIYHAKFVARSFLFTGGMPSTHTAFVTTLLLSIILEQGFSVLAAIGLVLLLIVIVDALGVRRTVGEEAQIINQIIIKERFKLKRLHFAKGHKPLEVLGGVFIGILVSLLVWMF
ncbi:divergent PAP2 family protein [Candidatus Woesearchaeota archaeon]|nr:divergent PAP2 family protein [Candidatus Woesearchaeota archaeon]